MIAEIDSLISGFIGGCIGCSFVFSIMYIHFHLKFKEYFFNKEHFKTRMLVVELTDKVHALSIQVGSLNAEIYNRVVEDEYR